MMSLSGILSVFLFSCVVHGAVFSDTKGNSPMEDFVFKTLEKFRDETKGGKQILGYPSIDPMHISTFNYSLTNSPIGFRIDILFSNGTMFGLSNSEISAVTWDAAENTIKTKMMFPTIQMKVSYNMDGNMLGFFPLIGFGTATISASNTYATGEASIKKSGKSLTTEDLKLTLNEPRVKSTFTDSIRRGQFSGIASELLNAMGPQIFNTMLNPIIADSMTEQLQAYINRELSSADGNELLASGEGAKTTV